MDVDGTQPWHKGAPYVPTTIGHIPTCAQKALEFVKFFPGEERCAALRPFMIRYKLFPENCKDPKVAPITMHELKGLVRMWKLHNQKGFWAEHKTRDSIVLALYERMQFLGKESRDRRARRDADRLRREGLKHSAEPVLTDEERATLRLQALSGSSGNRRASLRDLPDKDKDMTPCIMYRSRGFGDSEDRCNPRSPSPDSKRRQRFFAEEGAALEEEVVEEDHKQVLIKRKCSTALLNMSLNKKMSSQFVEQGGLHALLDLASTCRDDEIITNCAAALNNLIPFGDYYPPQKLCDLGVVKVVVALVNSDDARVRHFMALCLCKMSEEPGLEDRLATQGALTAATRLVAVSDSVRTKEIAAKVLINLAVGLDGNQADTTVKAVLRCVAVLVTHRTKTGDPDPATHALCSGRIYYQLDGAHVPEEPVTGDDVSGSLVSDGASLKRAWEVHDALQSAHPFLAADGASEVSEVACTRDDHVQKFGGVAGSDELADAVAGQPRVLEDRTGKRFAAGSVAQLLEARHLVLNDDVMKATALVAARRSARAPRWGARDLYVCCTTRAPCNVQDAKETPKECLRRLAPACVAELARAYLLDTESEVTALDVFPAEAQNEICSLVPDAAGAKGDAFLVSWTVEDEEPGRAASARVAPMVEEEENDDILGPVCRWRSCSCAAKMRRDPAKKTPPRPLCAWHRALQARSSFCTAFNPSSTATHRDSG